MGTELAEGQRGTSNTFIFYPRVSSCLTVSIICPPNIYGMHGVQFPEGDQRSIFELIAWLKYSTGKLNRLKMIIACDFLWWGDNGALLTHFSRQAADFSQIADYVGVPREGTIKGEGTYGSCQLVDLGAVGEGDYFNAGTSSAYVTVDTRGWICKVNTDFKA